MLEKRNRNLCWVQDETVAECCSEPLKYKIRSMAVQAVDGTLAPKDVRGFGVVYFWPIRPI